MGGGESCFIAQLKDWLNVCGVPIFLVAAKVGIGSSSTMDRGSNLHNGDSVNWA